MIASQSLCKDEIINLSSINYTKNTIGNSSMEQLSSVEDKNGNLEMINENVSTVVVEKVCRTCLNLVQYDSCISFTSLNSENKLVNMVTTCLPQIDLLLTNDPVVCQKCFTRLENFYTFFINFCNIEKKLVNYCTTHNLVTPINLTDMQKHKLEENLKYSCVKLEDEDNPNTVTKEQLEEDIDTNSNDAEIKSEDEMFSDYNPDEPHSTDTEEKKKPLRRKRKTLKRKSTKSKSQENKTLFSEDLAEAAVKCEICNKKFPSKWALDRHTPVHNTDRSFVCDECHMAFRYKHSFQKHMLAHLNGAPITKPFACDCGKFFNRKAKLKKHQQIHVKKEKPFGCEHCGKRFIDQESLSGHVFRVHASEKAFSCEVCGNKYSSKSGLDVHFKTHFPSDKPKPEPDLMCDFCGKLFYRKYSLEKHRMSHTGDKPHECEECGMRFKERYQLTIHNRRHTGEKPFDCEICGFKFPSKNRLGVHMRIHTGVRPFPCQMCDMAFTRKDHLIKHVRAIHTGERPFECDVCLKTFNRRDYLIKHKKVHTKRGL